MTCILNVILLVECIPIWQYWPTEWCGCSHVQSMPNFINCGIWPFRKLGLWRGIIYNIVSIRITVPSLMEAMLQKDYVSCSTFFYNRKMKHGDWSTFFVNAKIYTTAILIFAGFSHEMEDECAGIGISEWLSPFKKILPIRKQEAIHLAAMKLNCNVFLHFCLGTCLASML